MFSEEHFKRFMDFVFPSDGCLEVISWGAYISRLNRLEAAKYAVTQGGWFDSPAAIRNVARHAEGVSLYVTFNPVDPVFLSNCKNRTKRLDKGEATKAEDILSVRFMLVDIDCERKGGKVSATRSEVEDALDLRNRIIEKRPEFAESSIWGCSGNGGYILTRMPDMEPTQGTADKIKAILSSLAVDFDAVKKRHRVHIDTNPHFANAHIGIPGTLKCKGTNTEERPWRIITVDGGQY